MAGVALARLGRSALVQSATPLVVEPRELAGFAERWDPRRRVGAETARAMDREAFWRGATEAMAQILETPAAPQHWPGSGLKRAELLRQNKYKDLRYTREGRAPAAEKSEDWEVAEP